MVKSSRVSRSLELTRRLPLQGSIDPPRRGIFLSMCDILTARTLAVSPQGDTCRGEMPETSGRPDAIARGGPRGLLETHRSPKLAPDVLRLSVVPAEVVQQLFPERVLAVLSEGQALGVDLPADVGQLDAHVARRIADQALGVLAVGDRVDILEQLLAQHRDAAVARAEVLLRAVGDRALADPGDDVLVDDMAGDPAPGRGIPDGARPRRDPFLLVGLRLLGHADEGPGHREHVLVVDGNAPLEVLAQKKSVRPQAHAPDRPQR